MICCCQDPIECCDLYDEPDADEAPVECDCICHASPHGCELAYTTTEREAMK